MCLDCESAIPVELELDGFVSVAGASTRFVGRDALAAALAVPDVIPARGRALLVKAAGASGWQLRRFLGDDEARPAALALVGEGATVLAGNVAAVSSSTGEAVIALDRLLRPAVLEDLLEKSARAAGELLERVGVRKAPPIDPTTPAGMQQLVGALSAEMKATAGRVNAGFMDSLVERLDVNWRTATPDRIVDLANAINSASRIAAGEAWVGMRGTIYATSEATGDATRQRMIQTHNWALGTSLALSDKLAVADSASRQSYYIRDLYTGQIAPTLSRDARSIVSNGIRDGLGRTEIGAQLHAGIRGKLDTATRSYCNVAAGAIVARSRTYSGLITMRDSGVTLYVITAVLDERTTETCRYLDGKILNVEQGLRSYDLVKASDDPRAVEVFQPWYSEKQIRTGTDAGKGGIFLRTPDGPKLAAVIERAAMGQRDGRGSYRPAGRGDLQNAEGPPPYHGLCRTIVIPDVTGPVTATTRVPLTWAPGPPPVAGPSGAGTRSGANAEDLYRQESAYAEAERWAELRRGDPFYREASAAGVAQLRASGLPLIAKGYQGYGSISPHADLVKPEDLAKLPEVARFEAFARAAPARAISFVKAVNFCEILPANAPKGMTSYLSEDRVLLIQIPPGASAATMTEQIGKAVNYLTRTIETQWKKWGNQPEPERMAAIRDGWGRSSGGGNNVRTWKASTALDPKRFDQRELSKRLPDLMRYTPAEFSRQIAALPDLEAARAVSSAAVAFVDERFDKRWIEQGQQRYNDAAAKLALDPSFKRLGFEAQVKAATDRARGEIVRDLAQEFVALHGPTAGQIPTLSSMTGEQAKLYGAARADSGIWNGAKYGKAEQSVEDLARKAWRESVAGRVSESLVREVGAVKMVQYSDESKVHRGYYASQGWTPRRTSGGVIAHTAAATYGAKNLTGTLVHEYGHALASPGRTELMADALVRARWTAMGGKFVDAIGGPGSTPYAAPTAEIDAQIKAGKEIGLHAGFLDPYCGRTYGFSLKASQSGAEVLSMGAEWILEPSAQAWRFYQGDREHFGFTLAFLAGLTK